RVGGGGRPAVRSRRREGLRAEGSWVQPICKCTASSSRVAGMTGTPHAEAPSAPILAVDGARATIRLNRPRHHNRIETGDIAPLCKHFARIEKERGIRVLVLAAAGRTFCAGFNLEELAPDRYDETAPGFDRMVDQLGALRVPTVAAVGGSLYGGGTDLALACDFRIRVPRIEL